MSVIVSSINVIDCTVLIAALLKTFDIKIVFLRLIVFRGRKLVFVVSDLIVTVVAVAVTIAADVTIFNLIITVI